MSWRQVHLARAVYDIRGNVDGSLGCFDKHYPESLCCCWLWKLAKWRRYTFPFPKITEILLCLDETSTTNALEAFARDRVIMIRYPHDTIRIAILESRDDTYRDTCWKLQNGPVRQLITIKVKYCTGYVQRFVDIDWFSVYIMVCIMQCL